jgi:hypothetical protein
MPLVVKDRVRENSVTSGTGTITLTGAVTSFQTFSSAIGNGNTTYYTITEQNTANFEVGIGTVGAGTLTRDTVLESSNGGTKVNFGSAAKDVFCTYPAEKSVDIDTPQTLTNKTINASQLVDGSITTAKIANNAITSAKMANGGAEFGMRNRIINGAMMIDQRNAGASVTPTTDLTYNSVDRWQSRLTVTSKYSIQQNAGSVTPPVGFTNYLGVTSLSSYSVGASEYFAIEQKIEGFNMADFAYGTASASTVTLSFWVRSSLTGTFGGNIRNQTSNYCYPFSYTISSANTWEQKSVTITGATAGTWITNNLVGLNVAFNLGVGSTLTGTANTWYASTIINPTGATSVVGTNGATFYITGVQLEKGSQATAFEWRSYGTELALCQRYYQLSGGVGRSLASATMEVLCQFCPPMRATPSSAIIANGTSTAAQLGRSATNINSISAGFMQSTNGSGISVVTADTGLTTGAPAIINPIAIGWSAEL